MVAALPIVVDEPAVPAAAQDCTRCDFQTHCWGQTVPRETAIALLACRIQRRIRTTASVRLLLALLRPGLASAVNRAHIIPGHEGDALAELEAEVIEAVQRAEYMRRVRSLIVWLFDPSLGLVEKWVREQRRRRRAERRTIPVDLGPRGLGSVERMARAIDPDALVVPAPDPIAAVARDDAEHTRRRVERLIEDGKTLTAVEYRVLRFCLDHARRGSRLSTWSLHGSLAELTGWRRNQVSRAYAVAQRKVVAALGPSAVHTYLAKVGLKPVRLARKGAHLTSDGVTQLVELAQTPGVSVLDVALATGVSETRIRYLKRARSSAPPPPPEEEA